MRQLALQCTFFFFLGILVGRNCCLVVIFGNGCAKICWRLACLERREFSVFVEKLITFRKFWWFFRKKGSTKMSPSLNLLIFFAKFFLIFLLNKVQINRKYKWFDHFQSFHHFFFKIEFFWKKSDVRIIAFFCCFQVYINVIWIIVFFILWYISGTVIFWVFKKALVLTFWQVIKIWLHFL